MNTDMIIKGLVKEFEMEGTKEFLKNFNMSTRRVDKMSMFIGKYKNFTFMCNGHSLMGYMKRPEDSTVHFTFRNLNELPWVNIYDPDLKLLIKKVIDLYFKTNAKLLNRYNIIMEAANDYETILLRALNKRVIKIQELRKETRLLIANKLKDETQNIKNNDSYDEVACDYSAKDEKDLAKEHKDNKEEKGMDKMNVMQLAHKIRREEKLEGHYHAQMKYALKKAHEILNGTFKDDYVNKENENVNKNLEEDSNKNINSKIEDLQQESDYVNPLDEYNEEFLEEYEEEEEDEDSIDSLMIDEDLSPKEVVDKYKGKYESYIYFNGSKVSVNIQGKTKVIDTAFNGLKLEKYFADKLDMFTQHGRTLVIHRFKVFERKDKVDFVRIP